MRRFNRGTTIPFNLQLFAEPGAAGTGGDPGQQAAQQGQQQPAAGQQTQAPAVDYTKIQQMLDGTLAAKEDTALKAYFKQQGLSQEEAEQAMAAFKQQKAAQQPDVAALQTQMTQAQAAAQRAAIENKAILTAIELGIDAKTVPYILKLADLSQIMGQDGKINEEGLKNALNKVLDDVPALKPVPAQAGGFQLGASGGQGSGTTTDAELDRIFGVKK